MTTYNISNCQAHSLADTLTISLMYKLVLWNNFQKKIVCKKTPKQRFCNYCLYTRTLELYNGYQPNLKWTKLCFNVCISLSPFEQSEQGGRKFYPEKTWKKTQGVDSIGHSGALFSSFLYIAVYSKCNPPVYLCHSLWFLMVADGFRGLHKLNSVRVPPISQHSDSLIMDVIVIVDQSHFQLIRTSPLTSNNYPKPITNI